MANPTRGSIVAVSTSKRKGEKKSNQERVSLAPGEGIVGDAHAGDWHRQVSLLALESIERIRNLGLEVDPGDFAENITTSGLRLWELPIGARLRAGDQVILEVTQIGKECHSRCAIYHQVGDCVMPREGIFARVLVGGSLKAGDAIRVVSEHGE